MAGKRFSNRVLNRSLVVFFLNAVRIALRSPSQALSFLRTVWWMIRSASIRRSLKKRGAHIPPIIIYSITRRCNLSCEGCYSAALGKGEGEEMDAGELERIVAESKELGVSFFVIAGGEPFMRPEIVDAAASRPGMVFLVFTNGLLIDEAMARRLRSTRNLVPMISIEGDIAETDGIRGEGTFDAVKGVMNMLGRLGIFFGSSITLTERNFDTVTSSDFVGGLYDAGCRFFLFLEYTPIEVGTDHLVVGEGKRAHIPDILENHRKRFPALFIGVPWDEDDVGGCLSAGRGFVHIDPGGAVEPCPFAPFSDSSVRGRPLVEALQSPFLEKLREDPEFARETGGGCVLWKKREEVAAVLEGTRRGPGS
jgi:MoaA/NifB/PqqE/SkfB family radical SAM enzyme